jgi:hypothetical protein
MNAARRAMEQLESWPGLTSAPASCGTGVALWAGSHEIVHFHSDHDADLHLTSQVIARLHDELERSTAVRLHSASEWATIHLDCSGDADLLTTLASVALKAHATPWHSPGSAAPCNLARVEIMPAAQDPATGDLGDIPGRAHARRFTRGRSGRPHHRTA